MYRLNTSISSATVLESLTGQDIEDGVIDNPGTPVQIITQIFVESSNSHSISSNPSHTEDGRVSNISDSSVSHDKTINATNIPKENLNDQGNISQGNDVSSLPRKKKIQNSGCLNCNALCSKMLVIFGMCCVIGCYLTPIIFYFYYATQTRGNAETDPEFSLEKNTSVAKV